MFTQEEVKELKFVFEICLGYIAFAAGAEMYLPDIQPTFGSIIKIVALQLTLGMGLSIVAVLFTEDLTSYMGDLKGSEKIAVALIAAVIFMARSPSSAIAIINELGAKGPFVQTSLGVTMVRSSL